ncbi:MAG: hypothetical protein M3P98_01470 [bacterium]|nr:hypothetical protein [bacterium]
MKNQNKEMVPGIKYPRVMVSTKRHAKLMKEAQKAGINMVELAEHKFKTADLNNMSKLK